MLNFVDLNAIINQSDSNLTLIYFAFLFSLLTLISCVVFAFKVGKAFSLLSKVNVPVVWWYPKFWKQDPSRQRGQSLKKVLHNMQCKGGPFQMYGTVFGVEPVLHVGDPEVARLVLQGSLKQPAYNHFKGFCGEGVFTADGSDWKKKRASVLHSLFRKADLCKVAPLANLVADDLIDSFQEGVGFDFVGKIQHYTLALIYQFLTGEQLDQEAKAQRNFYLKAVSTIRMVILAFSRSLWMYSRTLYYMFSSLGREERKAMIPIKKFAAHAIKSACPHSPLQKLSERSTHYSKRVTMMDESITLLFAGQDTSAATLSWTMYLLALNPCWQDHIRQEVVERAGESGHIDEVTVTRLHYVDAVIKEALRLFPVAPFVARHLDRNISLPNGSFIPAGVTAIVWIYAMHHNPKFWDGAESFLPERWMKSKNKDEPQQTSGSKSPNHAPLKSDLSAYMPFAQGPRGCVGQPFAHIALRVMLARIMRDCRISLHETAKKEMQVGFTVLPENGLWIKLQRRVSQSTPSQ